MYCEIAARIDGDDLEKIQSLEKNLGLTLVAFSCRSLDPAREERLEKMMRELGPVLQAPPAAPDDEQLEHIHSLEKETGLALVAVEAAAD